VRATGVERAISLDFLRHVVETLESFRSHPLGFRVAGTPEERRATAFLAREMREMGAGSSESSTAREESSIVVSSAWRARSRAAARRFPALGSN
jgi:hypothetical protein